MITPDDCTSLICEPPQNYCYKCSHAIFYGEIDAPGIFKRFQFNPQFGPEWVDQNDRIMTRQPGERSKKVWDAWGKWFDEKFERADE